jgi:3-deoxy-D-manno-octulosonic-acid transferase
LPYLGYCWQNAGAHAKHPPTANVWANVWASARSKGPFQLWVHAVSLGETNAAIPLIKRIQQQHPDWRIIITTMTPTGSARATQQLGNSVAHCYLPYDIPWLLTPWLKRISAERLAIIETELWPNLIHLAAKQGVAIYLLNARLSEKSAKGYAKVSWITQPMLDKVCFIAAQDIATKQRFQHLGVCNSRIAVTGSIKFDIKPPADLAAFQAQWHGLIQDRFVWIAASTHAGEEALVLNALARLQQSIPNGLLILAPRHPERFQAVAADIEQRGLGYLKRSSLPIPAHDSTTVDSTTVDSATANSISDCPLIDTDIKVILLDSLGELLHMYSLVEFAVIGGSFIHQGGGHNPLEAAVYGKPIITGPQIRDFYPIYQALIDAQAAVMVNDTDSLCGSIEHWYHNPDQKQIAGMIAQQQLKKNQGALNQQIACLVK